MIDTLPLRAFFAFEVPIRHLPRTPTIDGNLRKWSECYLLPPLIELEGRAPFADVYAAWNQDGVFVAFDVPGRRGLPQVDLTHWWKGDGVRVCLDTRDTRTNKRGTRFCHSLYALPLGGGRGQRAPVVGINRLGRAKEPHPPIDLNELRVAVHVERTRYSLELMLPAAVLNGFDPVEHPRVGFFYKVKDTQLGSQHLTVDDELGWNADPSTWATAVLAP